MDLSNRLNDVLQPMILNAEDFARERDFETSMLLTTNAAAIYKQFNKLGVEDQDLHLILGRAYLKLATYQTVNKLKEEEGGR
jgi:hypothetical protein